MPFMVSSLLSPGLLVHMNEVVEGFHVVVDSDGNEGGSMERFFKKGSLMGIL